MERTCGGVKHCGIKRGYVGLGEYRIFPPRRRGIYDVESNAFAWRILLAFEDMSRFRRYHHSGAAAHGYGPVSLDLIYERAFHAEYQFEMPVAVGIVEYGFGRRPLRYRRQPSKTYLFPVDNSTYVLVLPHAGRDYTLFRHCAQSSGGCFFA